MTTFIEATNCKTPHDAEVSLTQSFKDYEDILAGKLSNDELIEYSRKLVKGFNHRKPDMYFISLAEPFGMPGDARVDYIYTPTYIASSIIMYTILKNEELSIDQELMGTLHFALSGCMGRDFSGHGYDCNRGFIDTMDIFSKGRVLEFVLMYPRTNVEFTRAIKRAIKELSKLKDVKFDEHNWFACDTNKARDIYMEFVKQEKVFMHVKMDKQKAEVKEEE